VAVALCARAYHAWVGAPGQNRGKYAQKCRILKNICTEL